MVNNSILRHLLNDDESLMHYVDRQVVGIDDIKRRLFLRERAENTLIPDHFYRLQKETNFEGIATTSEVLTKGLSRLASEHLELRQNIIYVKDEKHNQWQYLITYIPPLILQCALLYKSVPFTPSTKSAIRDYYNTYILPNTCYTSLPSPHYQPLNDILNGNRGFHDLHFHLNGSTETDLVWQDYLSIPSKIFYELQLASAQIKVKEQLEQESSLLNPLNFYRKLLYAKNIREILFDSLFNSAKVKRNVRKSSINAALDLTPSFSEPGHPFRYLLNIKNEDSVSNMPLEALMYICVFNKLSISPKDSIASLFHFYLLILGLANRLIVQQTHQYGFEQFQKLTLNGLREISEKEYAQRFLQMQGNNAQHLNFLEGRFSPKVEENHLGELLSTIESGWKSMLDRNQPIQSGSDAEDKLRLVAHFIKRPDNNRNKIRHYDLRKDNWDKANILWRMKKNYPNLTKRVCGIDAASSEFDTPPEVFAPLFRMLRRKGIKHFTYHAGEDFYHILSGLRAVFEAISFADLKKRDRIGHATATGIDIKQWKDILGDRVLIRKGEWLDDLTFAYYLIQEFNIEELKVKLYPLCQKIENEFKEIYGVTLEVSGIVKLWNLRKFCPILWFCKNAQDARQTGMFDQDEWSEICRAKESFSGYDELLHAYHSKRVQYDQIISVQIEEIFDCEELTTLQKAILNYMSQNEIVIETLPTSNVRIGIHRDYTTHQLWNWIKWKDEGLSIPHVVLGTDDPGIFATNIYNEYAHIYCDQVFGKKEDKILVANLIRDLEKDSIEYAFKP